MCFDPSNNGGSTHHHRHRHSLHVWGFISFTSKSKAQLHWYVPFHASTLLLNRNRLKSRVVFLCSVAELNPLDSILFGCASFSWAKICVFSNANLISVWNYFHFISFVARFSFWAKWWETNFWISFSGVEMTTPTCWAEWISFAELCWNYGIWEFFGSGVFSVAIYNFIVLFQLTFV